MPPKGKSQKQSTRRKISQALKRFYAGGERALKSHQSKRRQNTVMKNALAGNAKTLPKKSGAAKTAGKINKKIQRDKNFKKSRVHIPIEKPVVKTEGGYINFELGLPQIGKKPMRGTLIRSHKYHSDTVMKNIFLGKARKKK